MCVIAHARTLLHLPLASVPLRHHPAPTWPTILSACLLVRSPLGRGMLTGTLTMESLADDDIRRRMPRFQGENAQKARCPLSRTLSVNV